MLQILSVNYKSELYLQTNYLLTERLNKDFDWLVVCNDGNTDLGKYGKFECIKGAKMPPDVNCNVNKYSHHHGLGLNAGIKHVVKNLGYRRFLLLLDPDFFIAPKHEWVTTHMLENSLSFFGAPYANDGKWRPFPNFPTAFCMYIDRQKVDISEWDFRPHPQKDQSKWYDTGHKVYEKYADKNCFETVKNIKNVYTALKVDEYEWHKKLFGIHARMKLHHKDVNYAAMSNIYYTINSERKYYYE